MAQETVDGLGVRQRIPKADYLGYPVSKAGCRTDVPVSDDGAYLTSQTCSSTAA